MHDGNGVPNSPSLRQYHLPRARCSNQIAHQRSPVHSRMEPRCSLAASHIAEVPVGEQRTLNQLWQLQRRWRRDLARRTHAVRV